MQHAASAITAPDTDQLPVYWQFHEAVTRAQLTEWLPSGRHLLVDVSGPRAPGAELAAKAGHTVVRVIEASRATSAAPEAPSGSGGPSGYGGPSRSGFPRRGAEGVLGGKVSPQDRGVPGGRPPGPAQHPRIVPVIADSSRLTFLADGCADGVIADDRALSVHLAAEAMIAEIARVLRPGGRMLACVDSLVLGMAVLADQHHWAHLVDLPHAEVVLVPWPDGTITRCFGPDQARELFTGAGLRVNWIRSRTVFSESVVTHWLRRDPGGLPKLVRAELAARSDESLGAQLVISASKPRAPRGSGGAGSPPRSGGVLGGRPPG
ncbi:MAG: methyltransferase [Streptosporangiaceae bacterium]